MYYDTKFFEVINSLANHSKVVDVLGVFLADYFPYFLVIFLLVFLFWPPKDRLKNRAMVFVALASAIISRLVVKAMVLFFYERPRPYVVFPSAHKLISIDIADNFQSFPSGHAIFFFSLSMAICFYNKKLGILFFISSALMGIARVFAGVHWPSDIIGGLILGMITAFIIQKIYLRYKTKIGPKYTANQK